MGDEASQNVDEPEQPPAAVNDSQLGPGEQKVVPPPVKSRALLAVSFEARGSRAY